MRRIWILALLFVLTPLWPAAAPGAEPHHALVLVRLDSPAASEFMRANAGRLDVVRLKAGSYAHVVADPTDLEFLRSAGLQLEIIVADLELQGAHPDKGDGFGIFHTYSENTAFVDSLRLLYPQVVSEKWSIGLTVEGRDIWCFRISDNPDVDENEPEVLIDGMHHAREIMASEFPIMFAEHLASNYGSDPEITWLVDNRELYIVPIVNPDGVVYNEENYPQGGGMWRKNRRDNGDGTIGVDLNRNYPYMWGYDDIGSSPDPANNLYRGPAPGSEPEAQILMNFINGREFITHDTIHTYGNLVLYPWSYDAIDTPDETTFRFIGDKMTMFNGYTPGQPGSDILYPVNGCTTDWAYGAQDEHAKIFTVSTEIGTSTDYFWPPESRRGPLFWENVWPHLFLLRAAGSFVAVHTPVVQAVISKELAPGQDGLLDFTIENQSVVASTPGADLTLACDDPWIQLAVGSVTVSGLPPMGAMTLGAAAIPFSVDPLCPDGHVATVTVTTHLPEGDLDFPLHFLIGSPTPLLADDMENDLANWTVTGAWGLTRREALSGEWSLTDSPQGSYDDQQTTFATLNGVHQATELSFWHRYAIEDGWDYGRVQVSPDGVQWFTPISFTGTVADWEQVTVDLTDFLGQDLTIRFALEADYSVTEDGWYIDDVTLTGLSPDNLPPATPIALSPAEGATVGSEPVLTVSNSNDPEGSAVVYGFRIYTDAACTQLATAADDLPEGDGQTAWTAPVLAGGDYWWRAWAGDGEQRSSLTAPVGFTVTEASAIADLATLGPMLRILGSLTGEGARIQLNLSAHAEITLDIYDVRGARIRNLYSGPMAEGTKLLVWDGRDQGGRPTASGVYFVHLQAGSQVHTGRVVMVR